MFKVMPHLTTSNECLPLRQIQWVPHKSHHLIGNLISRCTHLLANLKLQHDAPKQLTISRK